MGIDMEYYRTKSLGREPLSYEEIEAMRGSPYNYSEEVERLREQLLDVLDSLKDNAVVPLHPTGEMIKAGMTFQGACVYEAAEVENIYKDMIAAHQPSRESL